MSRRQGYGQRRVRITPEVIEDWLVHERRVKTDMPKDARLMGFWQADGGDTYIMLFESREWGELEEGEEIPVIVPSIEE